MPVAVSCCIHVDIIVAMAVPAKKALCHGQFLWDVKGYMQGVISPQGSSYLCKTGQWHLSLCNGVPWCYFAHWLEIAKVPGIWLETVEVEVLTVEGMMRGFEHPMPLVSPTPLVLDLQFLLLLCS